MWKRSTILSRTGPRRALVGGAVAAALTACGSSTGVSESDTAGQPATMVVSSGSATLAVAGRLVDPPPAVRIQDAGGAPVAGVLVTFEPDPGSGTVVQQVVPTDTEGVAEAEWILGPDPGPQRLRVRATGVPDVTFSVTAAAGASDDGFQIEIRFLSEPTSAQRAAFAAAEQRWEDVIIGDLPDITVSVRAGFCEASQPFDETIDDLLILTELEEIDGEGDVLGSAGPCLIRNQGDLPILGRMSFDTADLERLESLGRLEDVIVHEMGHVLGIGSLWDIFGLLRDTERADSTVADPHFVGPSTLSAFEAIGGATYSGSKVPVEDTGGSGTRLSHWRESSFNEELMTGFINPDANPLSLVTVASLEDIGYVVDHSAADAYELFATRPADVSASRVGADAERLELIDDILDQPIYTIDEAGNIRPLRPR
ncbi:MAG: hypothetical protein MJB57_12980 [Gemmatimonadetes bacterium]|nr:hypothetical protein [Gemmatimonadota bacterium]